MYHPLTARELAAARIGKLTVQAARYRLAALARRRPGRRPAAGAAAAPHHPRTTPASAPSGPMPCSCRHCSAVSNPAPGRSGRPSLRPSAHSARAAAPDGSPRSSATTPRPQPRGCAGPAG